MAKPSEMANGFGTPKSVMRTCIADGSRALRANRSVHASLVCARAARERGTGGSGRRAGRVGSISTVICWWRTRWMQARRCTRRIQSHQSSGAVPTASGRSRRLTWRGFAVVLPFHWRGFRELSGTTTADAGSIHDAQAPVSFSAVFMRGQFLVCRAPKRSIRLESKILAREATGLPY
jgi:hypothetical protein